MSALICDGFEGTDIDSSWIKEDAVAIDNTFAHSGNSSVHFHIPATAPSTRAGARLIHPTVLAAQGPLWVRAWIKLGSLPAGANRLETTCIEQMTSPYNGSCVFLHSDKTSLYTQFAPANMDGDPPPTGPWFALCGTSSGLRTLRARCT